MKHCPSCKRSYVAEMSFCLDDGTPLVSETRPSSDPQAVTLVNSQYGTDNQKTKTLPVNELRPQRSLQRKVIAALVIVLISVGIIALVSSQKRSTNSNSSTASTAPPAANTHVDMVAIPGGTFLMGRDDVPPFAGLPQETPAHPVTVSSFSMDRTEVTNAEYVDFVRDTKHTLPSHWIDGKPPEGQEQWPVTNVSPDEANAFAAWRSKRDGVTYRLPTEEEWEYAARGGDLDNFYPWGSIWIEGRANVTSGSPKPVGSYPEGKARWGNLDMIGNVWEWTSSRSSYYPGNKNLSVLREHQDWVVIRGGACIGDTRGERAVTATYRDWISPTTKNEYLGFRLVRTGS